MKIFINFTVFFLVYASPLFAQPIKILRDKDSTLNIYLSHKLEFCNISDSCFAGIYNISFTLFPNGQMKEIMTSESLPQKYSDTITSIIKGLKDKWEKSFLSFVSKKNKTIIQPIYLFIYSDCKTKPFKKKNNEIKDTTNILFDFTESDELTFEIGKILGQLVTTFSESGKFKGKDRGLNDCLLLSPCIVLSKSKFSLKEMNRNPKKEM